VLKIVKKLWGRRLLVSWVLLKDQDKNFGEWNITGFLSFERLELLAMSIQLKHRLKFSKNLHILHCPDFFLG
jgi:hypothetical protein